MHAISPRQLLLFLLLGSSSALGGFHRSSRAREVRSASYMLSAGVSAATYRLTDQLTRTVRPGGMAYRAIRRPLLTPPQRLVVAACVAYAALPPAEALAARKDAAGRALRSLGALPLAIGDSWADRMEEGRKRRAEKRREEWLRGHSAPARIYLPEPR